MTRVLSWVLAGLLSAPGAGASGLTHHGEILDAFHMLREWDGTLDRRVLVIHHDEYHDFDTLDDALRATRAALDVLRDPVHELSGHFDGPTLEALAEVALALESKRDRVERFKTATAVFKNSAHFLPLAAERAEGALSDPQARQWLANALRHALVYIRGRDARQRDALEREMRRLRGLGLPPRAKDALTRFEQHLQVMLQSGPQAELLVREILATPVIARATAAQRAYLDLYEGQRQRDRWAWGLLGLFSVALVLQVVLAFRRLRRQRALLRQERDLAATTLRSIADAVLTTDAAGRITDMNPAAEALTGWTRTRALGKPVGYVLHVFSEITREPLPDPVEASLRLNEVCKYPSYILVEREDGTSTSVKMTVGPIRPDGGDPLGAVLVLQDVGSTRAMERELNRAASQDALTGLLNRRELELRVARALTRSQTRGETHVLCCLDIDQFRIINDSDGHAAGDALLREVADALRGRIKRERDVLARLGSDEFVLLREGGRPEEALDLACELREAVNQLQFEWQGRRMSLTAAVGVVLVDGASLSVTAVLKAADTACSTAKEAGRNQIHVYAEHDIEVIQREDYLRWSARVRDAIEQDRFVLFLQPIQPVAAARDERLYEVLLRMRDGDGSLIPPGRFLPAAERHGQMGAVDRWVIRAAVRALHRIREKRNGERIMFALNLSGQSLGDEYFLPFLRDLLDGHPGVRGHLCLEITETSAVSNVARARRFIDEMRGLGCRFALDDFGTGFSSFGQLQNFEVDYLKIDGSFVRDMRASALNHAIVDAITRLARTMGVGTVAEFVEDEDILEAIRGVGVDWAQGFGIARPAPIHEVFPELGEA